MVIFKTSDGMCITNLSNLLMDDDDNSGTCICFRQIQRLSGQPTNSYTLIYTKNLTITKTKPWLYFYKILKTKF